VACAIATRSLLGPGIGVSLSLYAVSHTHAGVAAALMGLTPILVMPIAFVRGEPIGGFGIFGAVIAVAGTALLALG
jgi:drug/metabolite transporter (DMT)-like permease